MYKYKSSEAHINIKLLWCSLNTFRRGNTDCVALLNFGSFSPGVLIGNLLCLTALNNLLRNLSFIVFQISLERIFVCSTLFDLMRIFHRIKLVWGHLFSSTSLQISPTFVIWWLLLLGFLPWLLFEGRKMKRLPCLSFLLLYKHGLCSWIRLLLGFWPWLLFGGRKMNRLPFLSFLLLYKHGFSSWVWCQLFGRLSLSRLLLHFQLLFLRFFKSCSHRNSLITLHTHLSTFLFSPENLLVMVFLLSPLLSRMLISRLLIRPLLVIVVHCSVSLSFVLVPLIRV